MKWTDPTRGNNGAQYSYEAPTFEALVKAVTDDRRKRGLRANYNNIYNEVKKTLDRAERRNIANKPNRQRKLSLKSAIAGANAAMKIVRGEIVDQVEIQRRADICLRCPMVTRASDCPSCSGGAAVVNAFNSAKSLIGKNYSLPEGLKRSYCDLCGCAHTMIIPTRLENFLSDSPELAARRPSNCWIHPTS